MLPCSACPLVGDGRRAAVSPCWAVAAYSSSRRGGRGGVRTRDRGERCGSRLLAIIPGSAMVWQSGAPV